MKKYKLKNIIKKSLINEQTLNSGVPTLGSRIYGCACDIAPGVPPEHWSWQSFGTYGWDPNTNSWCDWATSYPLTDGMGRVYTDAQLGALPHCERMALLTFGYLPTGPVGNETGRLFCPGQTNYFQGMNIIVDCAPAQDGQIIRAGSVSYTGVNFKIAHNGASMPEFKPWLYPLKNETIAPCPSGGRLATLAPPACSSTSVIGCTDPTATNYDPLATVDDGSCTYTVSGCMDSLAINYDPNATQDDGSCTYDFSDPSIHQMTRVCTCEDAPLDINGQPNNTFACNGGMYLAMSLRFSSVPAPGLNLINHQAQIGDIINDVPGHTLGTFPPNTLWQIIDVLGPGSGGAPAVVFQNSGGCPASSQSSGNATGVGYVGPRPIGDIDTMALDRDADLEIDNGGLKSLKERFQKLSNIKNEKNSTKKIN